MIVSAWTPADEKARFQRKENAMSVPTKIEADKEYGMPTTGMAPGLALLFNDRLYERCKDVARIMAAAEGFTPPHLRGKLEACFGVVQMSVTWRLTPQLVAASTYQTPGGRIGYEGKLIQAILENSGSLIGGVQFELFGDWQKIAGKFKKQTSQKGHEYPVPDWKAEDEIGLGVTVSAQVRGESEPRSLVVNLNECFPRNSTLWAVRPSQQIKYTAARAFANVTMPGIFMGVPFDTADGFGEMIDVTPARPQQSDFGRKAEAPAAKAEHDQGIADQLPSEDETLPEVGPPEALERGREDRRAGKHMRAVPPEWREPGTESLAEAWTEGWKAEDAEIATKKEGKSTK